MTNSPRLFREVTLRSAIKVMKSEGLEIAGTEIAPDGTVRVLTSLASLTLTVDEPNPFDKRDKHEPDKG